MVDVRLYEYLAEHNPNGIARIALAALMSSLSEDLWCAGWLTGTERTLWNMVQGGTREWGMGEVSQRQVDLLRLLSDEAEGWIIYGDDGPQFVPIDEWKATNLLRLSQPPASHP